MGVGPPCSSPCRVLPLPCGGGHPCAQALTLQLRALMALALAPGGADAPAAVFLLGEAGQGIAAALGEVGTRVTGRPAPPGLPPRGLFLPCQPVDPRFAQAPLSGDMATLRPKGQSRWTVESLTGCLGSVSWKQRPRGFWVGGRGCWGLGCGSRCCEGAGPSAFGPSMRCTWTEASGGWWTRTFTTGGGACTGGRGTVASGQSHTAGSHAGGG